jgi:hypothetical protein
MGRRAAWLEITGLGRHIRIRKIISFSFLTRQKNPRRAPRVRSVVFLGSQSTPLLPRSCGMSIDMTMAKTEGRSILMTFHTYQQAPRLSRSG